MQEAMQEAKQPQEKCSRLAKEETLNGGEGQLL